MTMMSVMRAPRKRAPFCVVEWAPPRGWGPDQRGWGDGRRVGDGPFFWQRVSSTVDVMAPTRTTLGERTPPGSPGEQSPILLPPQPGSARLTRWFAPLRAQLQPLHVALWVWALYLMWLLLRSVATGSLVHPGPHFSVRSLREALEREPNAPPQVSSRRLTVRLPHQLTPRETWYTFGPVWDDPDWLTDPYRLKWATNTQCSQGDDLSLTWMGCDREVVTEMWLWLRSGMICLDVLKYADLLRLPPDLLSLVSSFCGDNLMGVALCGVQAYATWRVTQPYLWQKPGATALVAWVASAPHGYHHHPDRANVFAPRYYETRNLVRYPRYKRTQPLNLWRDWTFQVSGQALAAYGTNYDPRNATDLAFLFHWMETRPFSRVVAAVMRHSTSGVTPWNQDLVFDNSAYMQVNGRLRRVLAWLTFVTRDERGVMCRHMWFTLFLRRFPEGCVECLNDYPAPDLCELEGAFRYLCSGCTRTRRHLSESILNIEPADTTFFINTLYSLFSLIPLSVWREGCDATDRPYCQGLTNTCECAIDGWQVHDETLYDDMDFTIPTRVTGILGRRPGGWVRDLTADGDVENNPGPPRLRSPPGWAERASRRRTSLVARMRRTLLNSPQLSAVGMAPFETFVSDYLRGDYDTTVPVLQARGGPGQLPEGMTREEQLRRWRYCYWKDVELQLRLAVSRRFDVDVPRQDMPTTQLADMLRVLDIGRHDPFDGLLTRTGANSAGESSGEEEGISQTHSTSDIVPQGAMLDAPLAGRETHLTHASFAPSFEVAIASAAGYVEICSLCANQRSAWSCPKGEGRHHLCFPCFLRHVTSTLPDGSVNRNPVCPYCRYSMLPVVVNTLQIPSGDYMPSGPNSGDYPMGGQPPGPTNPFPGPPGGGTPLGPPSPIPAPVAPSGILNSLPVTFSPGLIRLLTYLVRCGVLAHGLLMGLWRILFSAWLKRLVGCVLGWLQRETGFAYPGSLGACFSLPESASPTSLLTRVCDLVSRIFRVVTTVAASWHSSIYAHLSPMVSRAVTRACGVVSWFHELGSALISFPWRDSWGRRYPWLGALALPGVSLVTPALPAILVPAGAPTLVATDTTVPDPTQPESQVTMVGYVYHHSADGRHCAQYLLDMAGRHYCDRSPTLYNVLLAYKPAFLHHRDMPTVMANTRGNTYAVKLTLGPPNVGSFGVRVDEVGPGTGHVGLEVPYNYLPRIKSWSDYCYGAQHVPRRLCEWAWETLLAAASQLAFMPQYIEHLCSSFLSCSSTLATHLGPLVEYLTRPPSLDQWWRPSKMKYLTWLMALLGIREDVQAGRGVTAIVELVYLFSSMWYGSTPRTPRQHSVHQVLCYISLTLKVLRLVRHFWRRVLWPRTVCPSTSWGAWSDRVVLQHTLVLTQNQFRIQPWRFTVHIPACADDPLDIVSVVRDCVCGAEGATMAELAVLPIPGVTGTVSTTDITVPPWRNLLSRSYAMINDLVSSPGGMTSHGLSNAFGAFLVAATNYQVMLDVLVQRAVFLHLERVASLLTLTQVTHDRSCRQSVFQSGGPLPLPSIPLPGLLLHGPKAFQVPIDSSRLRDAASGEAPIFVPIDSSCRSRDPRYCPSCGQTRRVGEYACHTCRNKVRCMIRVRQWACGEFLCDGICPSHGRVVFDAHGPRAHVSGTTNLLDVVAAVRERRPMRHFVGTTPPFVVPTITYSKGHDLVVGPGVFLPGGHTNRIRWLAESPMLLAAKGEAPGVRVYGLYTNSPPLCHDSSWQTTVAAIKRRKAMSPPGTVTDGPGFVDFRTWVMHNLASLLGSPVDGPFAAPPMPDVDTQRYLDEFIRPWVNGQQGATKKVKRAKEALDQWAQLLHHPPSRNDRKHEILARRSSRVKYMLKIEKSPEATNWADPLPSTFRHPTQLREMPTDYSEQLCARMLAYFDAGAMDCMLGPPTKMSSKRLKKVWNLNSRLSYLFGHDNREIGKWYESELARARPGRKYFVTDYSNFDQGHSWGMHQLYADIMCLYGWWSPKLRTLFDATFPRRFYCPKVAKGVVVQGMDSGMCYTSDMNSFINALGTLYSFHRAYLAYGVSPPPLIGATSVDEFLEQADYFDGVGGDDGAGAIDGEYLADLALVKEVARSFGHVLKVYERTFWQRSVLAHHPVPVEEWDGSRWQPCIVMAWQFHRYSTSIGATLKHPSRPSQFMGGVALGTALVSTAVPVLRAFVRTQLVCGGIPVEEWQGAWVPRPRKLTRAQQQGLRESYSEGNLSRGFSSRKVYRVVPMTYEVMAAALGLSPSVLHTLEEQASASAIPHAVCSIEALMVTVGSRQLA